MKKILERAARMLHNLNKTDENISITVDYFMHETAITFAWVIFCGYLWAESYNGPHPTTASYDSYLFFGFISRTVQWFVCLTYDVIRRLAAESRELNRLEKKMKN